MKRKILKTTLLTALQALSVATSFVSLTSCASKDIFNGRDAFLIGEHGEQIWVNSLVDSNISPVDGKENEPIIIDAEHQYKRDDFNLQIVLNPNLEVIPDNFLFNCHSFNKGVMLDYVKIKSIGNNFMRNCRTFNHKLSFPQTLETIGDNFVSTCVDFNSEIVFPNNLKSIGKKFLSECKSFDHAIILPDALEIIDESFMSSCIAFQQELHLPANLKKIGDSFMYLCTNSFRFSDENFTKCTQLEEIGNNFLNGCTKYNNVIDLSNTKLGPSSIQHPFMYNCQSMNQYIDFGNLSSDIFDLNDVTTNLNLAMKTASLDETKQILIKGENMADLFDYSKWPQVITESAGTFYRKLVQYPQK